MRNNTLVSLAAISAAVSTFLITITAARALTVDNDASRYSEFVVYWSLLFWCYGIVVGIQQETTRAVRARAVKGYTGGAPVLLVALVLGGVVAGGVAISSPLWSHGALPLSTWVGPALVAVGCVLYALYAAGLGAASGSGDWTGYSAVMVLDAVGRLGLVGLAAFIGARLVGVETACVAVSLLAVIILLTPRFRTTLTARSDRSFWPSLKACVFAMASSTASAILVVGYPALVKMLIPNPDPADLAATMTVVQLTRAPIMLPLLAFQSVAVAAFVAKERPQLRDLAKPIGLVGVVGLVGAPLAAWLGPTLLRLLYGPLYVVSRTTFAILVLAAMGIAMLTLTGTLVLALGRHGAYMAGWLLTAAVAVGLLFLPGELSAVVERSLCIAPLFGIVVHVLTIRTRRR